MSQQGVKPARFLGSLKDALAAASRDDTQRDTSSAEAAPVTVKADAAVLRQVQAQIPAPVSGSGTPAIAAAASPSPSGSKDETPAAQNPASTPAIAAPAGSGPSAAEAARAVKAQTSLKADRHVEFATPPTTRVVRGGPPKVDAETTQPPRTQLVRGKAQVQRGEFEQDPVVGWLVVVGGAGMGAFRPIFEGNNTMGRARSQRIPLDFGDDAISSEEQAYIRYDSTTRSFLFVPNLAKTNIVSINDQRPTGAVELNQMDVITIGRTQLVFVPFCGAEFDWADLNDTKD